MRIEPRAIASRAVTGFSPTSTMVTRPRESTCDSAWPTRGARLLRFVISLRQEKRQALERHGEIHRLQLHARWNLQRAGRKVEDGLDSSCHDEIQDALGRRRRHGDDGDLDCVALGDLLEIVDVENRHAALRLLT